MLAEVIIFVYDVNRRSTEQSISHYTELVEHYCKEDILKIIVANKCDEPQNETRSRFEDDDFRCFSTSNKRKDSIIDMF